MLILIVSSGPDKGRVFRLEAGRRVTLGRDGDPLRLRDRKASRHHCELRCDHGRWVVADAGSRHGTYLNQEKIAGPTPIDDGDFIQVGNSVLVMARVDDAAAVAGSGSFAATAVASADSAAGGAAVNPKTAEVAAAVEAAAERADAMHTPAAARPDASPARPGRLALGVLAAAMVVIGLNVAVLVRPGSDATRLDDLARKLDRQRQQNDALARALADQKQQLTGVSDSLARLPGKTDQAELFADALTAQEKRLASRFAEVEPALARIEKRLEAGEIDPAWRRDLADALNRQLTLTAELSQWSETLDTSVAALLDRPGLASRVDSLAAAVAEAMPESKLADDTVRRTLVSLRDALEKHNADADARRGLIEDVRRASVETVGEQTRMLKRVLDRLEARDDLLAQLTELRGLVAKQPDLVEARLTELMNQHDAPQKLDQLTAAVDRLARRAGDAASAEALAAVSRKLDAAAAGDATQRLVETVSAMRELLAKRNDAVLPALSELATALERRPSKAELDAAMVEVKRTLAASRDRTLTELTKRLDAGEPLDRRAIVEAVRASVAEKTAAITPVLEEIARRVESHPSRTDLDQALAEARAALSRDSAAKFDRLLQAIDRRPSSDDLRTTVESALAEQPAATAEALERLAAAVEAQPTLEEIRAALQATRTAMRSDLHTRLARLTEGLSMAGELDDRFAAVSEKAERHLAETQDMLATILGEVRDREALGRLETQIAALAESRPGEAEADPLLDDVLAALRARESATDDLLAAADRLEAWPERTRELLNQSLAAVEGRLAQLESRSGGDAATADRAADLAGVLQRVRDEAHAGLEGLAARRRAQPRRNPADAVVSASPSGDAAVIAATPSRSSDAEPLTKLEMAYKLAFETGRPVTIGKASVDPETGEVSPGRVLDPTAAKAAGLKHWRDWYLMDDFAERRRLQKRAQEINARRTDEPLISLPE